MGTVVETMDLGREEEMLRCEVNAVYRKWVRSFRVYATVI